MTVALRVDVREGLAGRRQRDLVASSVGRIPGPFDQVAFLEVVDGPHEVALVEIERVGQLLLRPRAQIVYSAEDGTVHQSEAVLAQHPFQATAAVLGHLRGQVRGLGEERRRSGAVGGHAQVW